MKNEIQPLEINGKDSWGVGEKRRLSVESHALLTDRVHLKFGEVDLVVSADELQKAVTNACNHGRR